MISNYASSRTSETLPHRVTFELFLDFSFDPWSQEVECEWELSRRAELIATKNRLLSERPPPLRSSEETVFHATIEAVAEMLTGPTGSAGTVKSRISSLDATPIRWIHPADDRTIKVTFPGNTTSADPRLAHWMPNENGNNQLRNRVFVDHCIEKEPSDILRNNLCDEVGSFFCTIVFALLFT